MTEARGQRLAFHFIPFCNYLILYCILCNTVKENNEEKLNEFLLASCIRNDNYFLL